MSTGSVFFIMITQNTESKRDEIWYINITLKLQVWIKFRTTPVNWKSVSICEHDKSKRQWALRVKFCTRQLTDWKRKGALPNPIFDFCVWIVTFWILNGWNFVVLYSCQIQLWESHSRFLCHMNAISLKITLLYCIFLELEKF